MTKAELDSYQETLQGLRNRLSGDVSHLAEEAMRARRRGERGSIERSLAHGRPRHRQLRAGVHSRAAAKPGAGLDGDRRRPGAHSPGHLRPMRGVPGSHPQGPLAGVALCPTLCRLCPKASTKFVKSAMPERSYRVLLWILALTGLVLDQSSKYGVFAWLAEKAEHEYVVFRGDKGGFQFVAQFERDTLGQELRDAIGGRIPHVNQGALFGFLRDHKTLANAGFALISLLAAAAIVYWSTLRSTARDRWLCSAPRSDPGRHARQLLRPHRLQWRPRLLALELPVRLAGLQHRRLLSGVRRLPAVAPGLRPAAGPQHRPGTGLQRPVGLLRRRLPKGDGLLLLRSIFFLDRQRRRQTAAPGVAWGGRCVVEPGEKVLDWFEPDLENPLADAPGRVVLTGRRGGGGRGHRLEDLPAGRPTLCCRARNTAAPAGSPSWGRTDAGSSGEPIPRGGRVPSGWCAAGPASRTGEAGVPAVVSVCPSCGAPIHAEDGQCPACAPKAAQPTVSSLYRLVGFARAHPGLLALGFVLTLASTAASLVPPYLTMPLLDKVLIPYQDGEPRPAGGFRPGALVSGRAARGGPAGLGARLGPAVRAGLGQRAHQRRPAHAHLRPPAAAVAGVLRRQAHRRPDVAHRQRHRPPLQLPVAQPGRFRHRRADDRHDGGHPADASIRCWRWRPCVRCR